jgi:hypothetical protein
MWLGSHMPNSIKFWSPHSPIIQIQSNLAQIVSLIFNSNSIPNFEKLQWGNLFLIKLSTCPYFIWKLSSIRRPSSNRIHSNQFEKHLINSEPTLCVWAGPLTASHVPAPRCMALVALAPTADHHGSIPSLLCAGPHCHSATPRLC